MGKLKYYKFVSIFALTGILWIIVSDWLLRDFGNSFADALVISISKGIIFIAVMSGLLLFLLRRLSRAEAEASASIDEEQLVLFKVPNYFKSVPLVTYAIDVNHGQARAAWISRNVERVLGYSTAEAMVSGWWEDCILPEDRLRAQEESRRIIQDGGGHHFYRMKTAQGNIVHIHDELQRVEGSFPHRYLGILHDVSSKQEALEQVTHYLERLESTVLGTVKAISSMVEMRDPYTAGHESRVGELAVKIAEEMGLSADVQYGLRVAGLVHDIGKISVPSEYLTKPTRLTESEFNIIKTHPANGYQILKNVEFPWPVAEVAYQHHERLNGSGYPQGLKGDDILLEARIIAVADVIESMATSRPYRHALGLDVALAEIEKNAGVLYDKHVVKAAITLFREKGYSLTTKV